VLKLNDIQPAPGARKDKHRVGRGNGSGSGCTAGYGNNGASARSGDHYKPYFEGGQTPLSRRIPKRGFSNYNMVKFQIVNIGEIARKAAGAKEIDAAWLYDQKLIRSKNELVKVLGDGELSQALTIKADAFSAPAKEKIEKAKGKAEETGNAPAKAPAKSKAPEKAKPAEKPKSTEKPKTAEKAKTPEKAIAPEKAKTPEKAKGKAEDPARA